MTTLVALYLYGSCLRVTDPQDIDVLVVVDRDIAPEAALALAEPFLADLPALPLDLSVATMAAPTVQAAVAVHTGHLVTGEDLATLIPPPGAAEWIRAQTAWAEKARRDGRPAAAALAAVKALLAADGVVLLTNLEVPGAASGRWAALAAAAWESRRAEHFDHPDLDACLAAAAALPGAWRAHLGAEEAEGWLEPAERAGPSAP